MNLLTSPYYISYLERLNDLYTAREVFYNRLKREYLIEEPKLTQNEKQRKMEFMNNKIPKVKKLIFNDPATIVYWEDGSKTVVKCMEGTPFNEYYGFVCALAKKIYGSNSAIDREIQKGERG